MPDIPIGIHPSIEQDYIAMPASNLAGNSIVRYNSEHSSMDIDQWRGGIVYGQSPGGDDAMGGFEDGVEYAEDQHEDVRGVYGPLAGHREGPQQNDEEDTGVEFGDSFREQSSFSGELTGLSQNQASEVPGLGGYEYPGGPEQRIRYVKTVNHRIKMATDPKFI